MEGLCKEIGVFIAARRTETERAGQLVAFRLALGIDLSAAFAACSADRQLIILRLERIIERERLKGARRHWS